MASADVCWALPNTTWFTCSGLTPERSRACLAAMAPSWVAEKSLRVPPNVPNPVRTPERNTTSACWPCVFMLNHLPCRSEFRRASARRSGPLPQDHHAGKRRVALDGVRLERGTIGAALVGVEGDQGHVVRGRVTLEFRSLRIVHADIEVLGIRVAAAGDEIRLPLGCRELEFLVLALREPAECHAPLAHLGDGLIIGLLELHPSEHVLNGTLQAELRLQPAGEQGHESDRAELPGECDAITATGGVHGDLLRSRANHVHGAMKPREPERASPGRPVPTSLATPRGVTGGKIPSP